MSENEARALLVSHLIHEYRFSAKRAKRMVGELTFHEVIERIDYYEILKNPKEEKPKSDKWWTTNKSKKKAVMPSYEEQVGDAWPLICPECQGMTLLEYAEQNGHYFTHIIRPTNRADVYHIVCSQCNGVGTVIG